MELFALPTLRNSSAAVAAAQEPEEEALLRGLLIHSEEVDKILSGEKVFEIRNSFLRCVQEDESFYILRVFPKGTRNSNGQSIVEIAGTVTFRTNHWILLQCVLNKYVCWAVYLATKVQVPELTNVTIEHKINSISLR